MKVYAALFTKVLALLVWINTTSICTALNINGSILSRILSDIANRELRVAQVQDHYDKLQFRDSLLDGRALVTELSSSLSAKFDGPIQALKRIKQAIEEDIDQFPSWTEMPKCCETIGLSYSREFRTNVDINQACVTTSSYSPPERSFPTSKIRDVMIDNHRRDPNLKWQYFGKEDGIYLNYPAFRLDDCSNYDPRFRPFYVSTATPVHKDVVVVIDKSGSMGYFHQSKSLLQRAKDAAISVLETLNPNDRFGVVAFDSTVSVPGSNISDRSCHRTRLAEATPLNINFMKSQIYSITTGTGTDYEAALQAAFKMFVDSPDKSNDREKVILFLTDGDQSVGGDPLLVIRDENKKINNSVLILTYGLGQEISAEGIQKLTDMALQTKTDNTSGEKQIGKFTHITDPDYLRSSMASYYNRFSRSSEEIQNPIFSVPYQDLFGIGLITSICLPVNRSGGELVGVACSDVTISDIMSEISYFNQGELSYAFIIDGTGRPLIHPLLPLPHTVKQDPIYVDIKHLERSPSAVSVIHSMKIGQSGNKIFYSKRIIPRGRVLYEGIDSKHVLSHYYWKPISQSNFSLCIVVGDNDTQPILETQTVTKDTFLYHRLIHTTANCRYFNRYATAAKTVVMLTPSAFRDPHNYLDTEETRADITKYEDYLTGKSNVNPGLKDSILNSVAATYFVENIWNKGQSMSNIWKYIGTTDGVLRFYPGAELPKNYDHTRRAWYKRTIALKGQFVVSAPYLDLWGSGYLITISKTITYRRDSGSENGQTVAVMGLDVSINYFYQVVLVDFYPDCKVYRCFVIDSSGFIVVHEDFANPYGSPMIGNVHIIDKETLIAEDMIRNGIMAKTSCINFENIKEQYTYRVGTDGRDRMSSAARYKIEPVPKSNIFIVIKQRVYNSPSICCESYGTTPDSYKCSVPSCDCLCYDQADFDYCNNTYNSLSDAPQTCSPKEQDPQTVNIKEDDKIMNLPHCFYINCSKISQKSQCFTLAECNWCVIDSTGSYLQKPYCALYSTCYFGKVGTSDSESSTPSTSCSGGHSVFDDELISEMCTSDPSNIKLIFVLFTTTGRMPTDGEWIYNPRCITRDCRKKEEGHWINGGSIAGLIIGFFVVFFGLAWGIPTIVAKVKEAKKKISPNGQSDVVTAPPSSHEETSENIHVDVSFDAAPHSEQPSFYETVAPPTSHEETSDVDVSFDAESQTSDEDQSHTAQSNLPGAPSGDPLSNKSQEAGDISFHYENKTSYYTVPTAPPSEQPPPYETVAHLRDDQKIVNPEDIVLI